MINAKCDLNSETLALNNLGSVCKLYRAGLQRE